MTVTDRWLQPPSSEADMVDAALAMLGDRLPPKWSLTEVENGRDRLRPDALLVLRSPDGGELRIIVRAKRLLRPRDVHGVKGQLDNCIDDQDATIGLVAAQYLSRSARESLSSAGLSYVDATGNLLMSAEAPAVFISDRGADSDPWRGPGRPPGTLKGEPAAKVVRTLLDIQGSWRIRDLVTASASSTGSVYRVMEFLETEALARRGDDGLVTVPDWIALLRRWSEDYQFLQTNSVTKWIAPRGIEDLLERIRKYQGGRYAVTGSIAAATWAPYAPIRSAMIYTSSPEHVAHDWGLRATDTAANVLLARPKYDVLVDRTVDRSEGLCMVAPIQVAADLMTGPGRAPSEAEELLGWMKDNEHLWRGRT